MKDPKPREVEVTNQRMEAILEQSLKPWWGNWWFPFKVKMKGPVAWAEKTTSKEGKILKKKDMMEGQICVQQVIRMDGTILVLRSRN